MIASVIYIFIYGEAIHKVSAAKLSTTVNTIYGFCTWKVPSVLNFCLS